MATTNEERIRQAILQNLESDGRLEPAAIHVEVINQTVRLSGTSPSRAALQAAEENARSAGGVRDVENRIQVRRKLEEKTRDDRDIRETAQKLIRLVLGAEYPDIDVSVSVTDGVVRLTGSVETYWAKRRAEELVGIARGVLFIVNDINVRRTDGVGDFELAQRVRNAVRSVAPDVLQGVEVQVDHRTAIVSGTVPTGELLRSVYDAACRVRGVMDVRNQLFVE